MPDLATAELELRCAEIRAQDLAGYIERNPDSASCLAYRVELAAIPAEITRLKEDVEIIKGGGDPWTVRRAEATSASVAPAAQAGAPAAAPKADPYAKFDPRYDYPQSVVATFPPLELAAWRHAHYGGKIGMFGKEEPAPDLSDRRWVPERPIAEIDHIATLGVTKQTYKKLTEKQHTNLRAAMGAGPLDMFGRPVDADGKLISDRRTHFKPSDFIPPAPQPTATPPPKPGAQLREYEKLGGMTMFGQPIDREGRPTAPKETLGEKLVRSRGDDG